MLNDSDIRKICSDKRIITPFDESQLQPCSYDVTLSERIIGLRVIGQGQAEINAMDHTLRDLEYIGFSIPDDGYVLHPNDFILGSTKECVSIPKNVAARFEGKSSLGRLGLMTHVTAGFIDPGFSGEITLEIKNLSTYPIRIFPGMKIGQLCFFDLHDDVDRAYGSHGLGSHYQNQSGPTTSWQ